MNGDGTFNPLILVDKLAKLNSSQQSIETLSHWCIFHRKNAKQVVETWERQFHSSPRDQRVSFLYLANDILQNSRRKGMEFVGEFWRVLPHALNDAIENGDELGRKAALRLVDIWEERKVFSPRGQTLKEELLGRNRNERNISYKLKQPSGDMLEKLIASYQHASNGYDEDTLFGKCRAAISAVIKVESEVGCDFNLGNFTGTGVADELQNQHGLLRECIEQLKVAESSRTVLVSCLREALNEQERKIEQLRSQLQVAQVRYEQVERLLIGQAPLPPLPEQNLDEVPPPPPASAYTEAPPPPGFPPESLATTIGDRVQATSVCYTPQKSQGPLAGITLHHTTNEDRQITAVSDVGTKLTSSTSSVQMLSYVSLASEGVISQSGSEEYLSDAKRPRLNNGSLGSLPCYLPQPQQPPPPPFLHPGSMHQPPPPLPLTLPPVPPPLPPAGSMSVASFSYGTPPVQPLPPAPPAYPMVGVPPYPGPPNVYQFQGSDGGFFGPPEGFFGPPPYPAGPPPFSRH